jgi:hypothetical protein
VLHCIVARNELSPFIIYLRNIYCCTVVLHSSRRYCHKTFKRQADLTMLNPIMCGLSARNTSASLWSTVMETEHSWFSCSLYPITHLLLTAKGHLLFGDNASLRQSKLLVDRVRYLKELEHRQSANDHVITIFCRCCAPAGTTRTNTSTYGVPPLLRVDRSGYVLLRRC